MTTTMLKKIYRDVKRIIDLALDKVDEKDFENLSRYRVVDQMPSGHPLMEDVV